MIVGATSGIAKAVAVELARGGSDLTLLARDLGEADAAAQGLRLRFEVAVVTVAFDACADSDISSQLGGGDFDAVVICYGVNVDRDDALKDPEAHRRMIDVNYTSTVLLLGCVSDYFVARGGGTIAALSSVAGDRGRSSNYPYAATKAGLSAYLSGMRADLLRKGVRVITVKPGPTATPMTDGVAGVHGSLADASKVARDIVKGMRRGRDVVYTPCKWRLIMFVVRSIPERLFKRIKF